ncbi:hypothetical protein AB0P16_14980 [Dietzia maris]|uniref:hypothetical protein n=1 Tax=Dietzia maris TaxID=37915 RepID=UPI0034434D5F
MNTTTPGLVSDGLLRRFGRWHTVLFLVYVVGLVALIVTAVRPDWTDTEGPTHSAVAALLAPGAWYTAGAMAVLAVLLAQRIRAITTASTSSVHPWIAGFLVLSSIALSFTSYSACQMAYEPAAGQPFTGNGPFDPVIRPFIDSISLFAFAYYDPFVTDLGHCTYLPPLALLTSRLIAATATSSFILAMLFSFSERSNAIRSIRRAPEIQVAIGIDADSADFLASIARDSAGDSTSSAADLVVLTRFPDRPEVERVRAEGARVVTVDLENPDTIRRLIRTTSIRRLYLLHSDAAINLHRLRELSREFTGIPRSRFSLLSRSTDHEQPTCSIQSAVVRIDNVWDAEDWRAQEIGKEGIEISVVGLYESTAQALVRPFRDPARDTLAELFGDTQMHNDAFPQPDRNFPRSTRNFVICGSSQLTLGLLSALNRTAYEEGRLRIALASGLQKAQQEDSSAESPHPPPPPPSNCVAVHLIAPEASSIASSFEARVRRRQLLRRRDDDVQPLHIHPVDADPAFSTVKKVLNSIVAEDGDPPPVVIVTDSVSSDFALLATMIADISAHDATVYEHNEAVWTPVSRGPLGLRHYGLNLGAPMGDPGEASHAIAQLDDVRAIAELAHTEYLLNWVDRPEAQKGKKARRAAQNYWEELDPFFRQDNERPARQALRNLRNLREKGPVAFLVDGQSDEARAELDVWLQSGDADARSAQAVLLAALRRPSAPNFEPPLSDEMARAVFIRFAQLEHESWLRKRHEADPPWTRPTLADLGFGRSERPDGTYFLPSPGSELSALSMDEQHKNTDVLTWQQLCSKTEQQKMHDGEWEALTSGADRLAEGAFTEFSRHAKIRDPGKVFNQVVTVLYHLDALGYLSAVLGEGKVDSASMPDDRAAST